MNNAGTQYDSLNNECRMKIMLIIEQYRMFDDLPNDYEGLPENQYKAQ